MASPADFMRVPTQDFTVNKLDMKDGDILVVKFHKPPDHENAHAVTMMFRTMFQRLGLRCEVCVSDRRIEFEIIRTEAITDRKGEEAA